VSSTAPVTVSGITNATAISAGGQHACALLSGGTVECWGVNWGRVPYESGPSTHAVPAPVPGITDAVAIAAGGDHTCALLSGGKVVCWGADASGQLGNGQTVGQVGNGGTDGSTKPVPVSGITDATGIFAGGYGYGLSSACAVVSGGKVVCWGANDKGQLGDGTQTSRSTPVKVTVL
jgi:alpha-tubulin suppressor-like RCC1 family protein